MLAEDLSQILATPVEVVSSRSLGGGCISETMAVRVRCRDPSFQATLQDLVEGDASNEADILVKRNQASMLDNFQCEREGLAALRSAEIVRVPAVIASGTASDSAYLVLERIDTASRAGRDAFAHFGEQLARLHRATRGETIGWHRDNYLGAAAQPNGTSANWIDFVAEQRLGHQLGWAIAQGLADETLKRTCEQVVSRLPELLSGREESTSLLHGDLWSGNYLFDQRSMPVLIDPAVYRGCREAEWGMIQLFGSCPPEFGQAYEQAWPMADGWKRRVNVYVLYHLLNHLNLFGSGYLGSCHQTAEAILRSG